MTHDNLDAKASLDKMARTAIALADAMIDLLWFAHSREANIGYDNQALEMQDIRDELIKGLEE